MAAFMLAAKAIKDANVAKRGDIIMTMVVGEIGMGPIDEFQGPKYIGKG
jgi:acetylornithine deacetylase/succinyl-diaminopimelate desuccinylase-like protein